LFYCDQYYENLSVLLKELVDLRKVGAIEYKEYLKQVLEAAKNAANPSNSKSYPAVLVTRGQQALYDNLDQNEILALAIDSIMNNTKRHGWNGHRLKEKEVRNPLARPLRSIKNNRRWR
jgi:type I restriction enzyme R subunit